MKTKSIFFLMLIIGFSASLSSCKKNKTGDLKVNVVDGLGNPLGSGKTVYLYFGQSNFNNASYTESAVTNDAGQVSFFELTPGDYYADCDWQNQLGGNVTSEGSGTVEAKNITTITIAP